MNGLDTIPLNFPRNSYTALFSFLELLCERALAAFYHNSPQPSPKHYYYFIRKSERRDFFIGMPMKYSFVDPRLSHYHYVLDIVLFRLACLNIYETCCKHEAILLELTAEGVRFYKI